MSNKNKGGGSNIPEWLVTFADLMSILVCFFVLLISFSIQDKEKLQVVAGSMREAFGIKFESRKAGMLEIEGAPVREYVKSVALLPRENDTDYAELSHNQRSKQGPEANTHDIEKTDIERPKQFALAAAALRQAWKELPEITEQSSNILLEETPKGLHIQLVDEEGRSMFPEGSSDPYQRTRRILAKMAPILRKLPNRIEITGHTNASKLFERPGYTLWDLAADRAKSARQILSEYGVPHSRFYAVSGRADAEPLFPEDPFLAANSRVSILLKSEAPPIPPGHKP